MADDDTKVLLRTIERERAAKKAAEQFAEERTRELYATNKQLKNLADNLQSIADERTKELRTAKDEAERANAAKTAFLATMSHEIRTPLNVVLGMTDLVLDSELSQEQQALLKRVMANSETMLAIINDILDVSRIEAGELRIDRSPFNPREIVEDVAESLCVQAHDKRLQIVCEIDESMPRSALGDGIRMRQILLNLGSNAVKFTQTGDVILSASATRNESGAHVVELQVQDSGPGIAEDKLDDVFAAFIRLEENGANRTVQGAGLGLNISQSLAEAMGGELSVQSEEGVGSTFSARIPLEVDASAESCERLLLGSVFAAVVHPHDRVRAVICELLKRAGAQVVDAPTLESLEEIAGPLRQVTWIVERTDPWLKSKPGHYRDRTLILLSDVSSHVGALQQLVDVHGVVVPAPFRADTLYDAVETANGYRSKPRTVQPAPLSRPPAVLKQSRVLLVEDNPDSRAVFKFLLESFGLDVLLAENGEEAVRQLGTHSVDLVLSDLQMPVMDGYSLIEHIRKTDIEFERPPLTVVALSADATTGVRERCLAAGFDEYASKPVSRQTLQSIVEQHLDLRPKLLVVDDSVDQVRLTCKWLQRSNTYRVIHVSSGCDALALIKSQPISLALVDMIMPGMDGYEMVRNIRATKNGATIPIVAVTGQSGQEAKNECEAAGCTHFLEKPFRHNDLMHTVRDALRDTRTATPAQHPEPKTVQTEETSIEVRVDADMIDLLPDFFRNRWANLRHARKLVQGGDFAELKRIAHGEKGVGGTYGFMELSELAREIEKGCADNNVAQLDSTLDQIEYYLRNVYTLGEGGNPIRCVEFK